MPETLSHQEIMPGVGNKSEAAEIVDRIEVLSTAYIENPIEQEIREQLGHFRIYSRKGIKRGRNTRQFLLLGDAGTGKSSLIEKYVSDIPLGSRTIVGDDGLPVTYPLRPIVLVDAPADGTAMSLLRNILVALGEKLRKYRRQDDILRLVVQRFHEQQVELLAIDDAHHLVERTGGKGKLIEHNARVLKELLKYSGAGIVLVGLPRAKEILEVDENQNGRRTDYEFRLKALDWNDEDERAYFQGILAKLEDLACFAEQSFLWKEERAYRIHQVRNGRAGKTIDFIIKAASIADRKGHNCISDAILAEATRTLPGWGSKPTPFDVVSLAKPIPALHGECDNKTINRYRGKRGVRASDILPRSRA